MNVARTTVQRLYSDARKKMATFFVEGKKLTIKGGNYILCSKESDICLQHGNCHRHQRHNKFNRGDKE